MLIRMKITAVIDLEVQDAYLNDPRLDGMDRSYPEDHAIEEKNAIAWHYTEELCELEELINENSFDNLLVKSAEIVGIF